MYHFGHCTCICLNISYLSLYLSKLKPRDLDLLPIQTDGDGIIPDDLLKVLENNNARRPPKVLCTIPTGQNPSNLDLNLYQGVNVSPLLMYVKFH